jgi:uncharacterized phage protein gp47/JayE
MATEADSAEYGIVGDEFKPKGAVQIREDILDNLKKAFGSDISLRSSTQTMSMVEAFAIEIDQLEQNQYNVALQMNPDTATGRWLELHMQERDLEKIGEIPAETVIRFDVSAASAVSIPAETKVSNDDALPVEFRTDSAASTVPVLTVYRSDQGLTDQINREDAYKDFRRFTALEWINEAFDRSGQDYIIGYDTELYEENDDTVRWKNVKFTDEISEPTTGTNPYYGVAEVWLAVIRNNASNIDVYSTQMADAANWSPFDNSGTHFWQVRSVCDSFNPELPDVGWPGTNVYADTNYDAITSAAQIDWSGAVSKPADDTKYWIRLRKQFPITRGGTPKTTDDITFSNNPANTYVCYMVDTSDPKGYVYDTAKILASGPPYGAESTASDWESFTFTTSGTTDYNQNEDWFWTLDRDAGTLTISWELNGKPRPETAYYVKPSGYSVDILCTALVAGSGSNKSAGEINTLVSPISGVLSVINEEDINTGSDGETDIEGRTRLKTALFPTGNLEKMESAVADLPGVLSCKIIDGVGKFEAVVQPLSYPMSPGLYERVLEKIYEIKNPGMMPVAVIRIERSSLGYDSFPDPYHNVDKLGWVSNNKDGSDPLTVDKIYQSYTSLSDRIYFYKTTPDTGEYYYAAVDIVVTITSHNTGGTDTFSTQMTNNSIWAPLGKPGGVGPDRTCQIVAVADDFEAFTFSGAHSSIFDNSGAFIRPVGQYKIGDDYNPLPAPSSSTPGTGLDWNGAISEPGAAASYKMRIQAQQRIQRGAGIQDFINEGAGYKMIDLARSRTGKALIYRDGATLGSFYGYPVAFYAQPFSWPMWPGLEYKDAASYGKTAASGYVDAWVIWDFGVNEKETAVQPDYEENVHFTCRGRYYDDTQGYIIWLNPIEGNYYYAELWGAFRVADNVEIDVDVSINIIDGETLENVNSAVRDVLITYFRDLRIGDDIYYNEIIEQISKIDSIRYIENMRFSTVLTVIKGVTGRFDRIQCEQIDYIEFINSAEDRSGTEYIRDEDYNLELVALDGLNYIGSGTTCTITISERSLRTYVDGDLDINVDLNDPDYDTISELVTYIDNYGGGSEYNVSAGTNTGPEPSNRLKPETSVDITSSTDFILRGYVNWLGAAEPDTGQEYSVSVICRGTIEISDEEAASLGTLTSESI